MLKLIKHIIDLKSVKEEYLLLFKGFLLLFPFMVVITMYIHEDPFKVLRTYQDYDYSQVFQNEGAIGWYKYKLYRDEAHYDSFIMGNSCTMAFFGYDWKKYIQGSPFRFFSNAESLADLYYKLSALDNQKSQPIRNLLIVLDRSLLKKDYISSGFMHVMPPEVSHISKMRYQEAYIQGFFTPRFFIPYVDYKIFHVYRRGTMKGIINPITFAHYGEMNDAVSFHEKEIKDEGEKYWQTEYWQEIFEKQSERYTYPQCIYGLQKKYLLKIKAICDKHSTNVKIVISPSQTWNKLNEKDVRTMKTLFGNDNVFDYSGINKLSSDYHYFYDISHYSRSAGRIILYDIYGLKN